MAETVIFGAGIGSSKTDQIPPDPAQLVPRHDPGLGHECYRSIFRAIFSASGMPGATATISRRNPRAANASSTGSVAVFLRDATTFLNAA